MNLRWLETFRKVVELYSHTRAATILGISQPAVSQQLRNLEQYFGEQLVVTASRGVRITDAGQKVDQFAVQIETDLSRVRQDLADTAHGPEGLVRIARGPTALCHYIPHLLKQLWLEHLRISIRTATLVGQPMTDVIITGSADIAIQSGMHLDPRLAATPGMDDRIGLVCTPDHPLAHRDTVLPADLAGDTVGLISRRSETGRMAAEWLDEQNLTNVERVEFGATEAAGPSPTSPPTRPGCRRCRSTRGRPRRCVWQGRHILDDAGPGGLLPPARFTPRAQPGELALHW